MKSIVDELGKIAQDLRLDKQHKWMNSWEQFKLMYDIARSQDDIDRQFP